MQPTEAENRITKLEQNLRRFEEERRRFSMEREKFEQEKRQMEQVRFQRLIEFERKRNNSIQHRERERLAVEAAAIALVEIEKQRIALRNRRSKSKSRERTRSVECYDDDYESSTASTISSRAADFDDVVGMSEVAQNALNGHPIVNGNGSVFETIDDEPSIEISANVELKQSWLSRMVFGKRKSIAVRMIEKKSYRHMIVDDGGPISIKRILTIEAPLVWQQLVEDHECEWAKMMRLRDRCIANFVLLSIFFGFGGMVFRGIEGAFENFYKCGVRRVKRDFVDHLWSSSHDMRFEFAFSLNPVIFVSFFFYVFIRNSEDDWKSLARSKLRGFEDELHSAHEAGHTSYSGLKSWTFINSVVYCMTVVTTIGEFCTKLSFYRNINKMDFSLLLLLLVSFYPLFGSLIIDFDFFERTKEKQF